MRRPQSEARAQAAEWFGANWDRELTLGAWWRLLAESGWGQPTWPLGRGGRGLSSEDAAAVAAAAAEAGRRTGNAMGAAPTMSIQKLAAAISLHRLGQAALDVERPYATPAGTDALFDDSAFEVVATAYMISIGGGTDRIQRNIIGERLLGLAGEPRVDKTVPFRQLGGLR